MALDEAHWAVHSRVASTPGVHRSGPETFHQVGRCAVMGINLDTLRPEPCVEGHTTPGGYSSKAVKPIALAKARLPLLGLGFS